jgi:hypothetical protein
MHRLISFLTHALAVLIAYVLFKALHGWDYIRHNPISSLIIAIAVIELGMLTGIVWVGMVGVVLFAVTMIGVVEECKNLKQ